MFLPKLQSLVLAPEIGPCPLPLADLSLSPALFPSFLVGALVLLLGFITLNSIYTLSTNAHHRNPSRRHWLAGLIYVIFLSLIAVLGITAFGSILRWGTMSGYALLAHLGAAGAFTFLLVAISWIFLPKKTSAEEEFRFEHRWWLARWSAWLLVIGSLVVAATMFLSMLPILDTPGLKQIAEVHRYAGLVTMLAAIVNAHAMICTRLGWR